MQNILAKDLETLTAAAVRVTGSEWTSEALCARRLWCGVALAERDKDYAGALAILEALLLAPRCYIPCRRSDLYERKVLLTRTRR